MKYLICAIIAVAAASNSYAQTNPLLGQYFQNLHVYNPALTGINDPVEINMGIRRQWGGFEGSPRTVYLSASGNLQNLTNLKQDERTEVRSGIKHGVGMYLLSDKQGPYKQTEMAIMYAVHVPITSELFLAMGASPSLYNAKVDMSDIWVKDMTNDHAYQSMVANGSSATHLHANLGLSLYSSRFYISFAMAEAINMQVSGNKDVNQLDGSMRQHILGGYRFKLQNEIELIPNAFFRLDNRKPLFFEGGMRARYKENYWVGVSVRNDQTYVGLLGFSFQDRFRIGYSYEYKTRDISRYSNGTNEINLGMRLSKFGKSSMF
jgi:type IX secretion system PorP/SprF family membrane protein